MLNRRPLSNRRMSRSETNHKWYSVTDAIAPQLRWYAVAIGRQPGIYPPSGASLLKSSERGNIPSRCTRRWSEVQPLVNRYPNSRYKSFYSQEQALNFMRINSLSLVSQKHEDLLCDRIKIMATERQLYQPFVAEMIEHSPPKFGITEDELKLIPTAIFTDGSSRVSEDGIRSAGWGIVCLKHGQMVGQYYGALPDEKTTNNQAELYAILKAFDIAGTSWSIQLNSNYAGDMTILTDSKYSIKCVTEWYSTWVTNGWKTAKGASVKNRDLIEAIRQEMDQRQVEFRHIKGHAGNEYNELADRLANLGRQIDSY